MAGLAGSIRKGHQRPHPLVPCREHHFPLLAQKQEIHHPLLSNNAVGNLLDIREIVSEHGVLQAALNDTASIGRGTLQTVH